MTAEEKRLADQLADAQAAVRAANESLSRLTTIVDEAFGMQPVMSTENLLTFLERSLYERRVAAEDAQRNAAQAVARVGELEGERAMAEALIKESAAAIRDLFADPEVARILSRDDWGRSLKKTLGGLEEWLTAGAAEKEAARG